MIFMKKLIQEVRKRKLTLLTPWWPEPPVKKFRFKVHSDNPFVKNTPASPSPLYPSDPWWHTLKWESLLSLIFYHSVASKKSSCFWENDLICSSLKYWNWFGSFKIPLRFFLYFYIYIIFLHRLNLLHNFTPRLNLRSAYLTTLLHPPPKERHRKVVLRRVKKWKNLKLLEENQGK